MKKLLIVIVFGVAAVATGCCTQNKELVMERTVPVDQYSATVEEMAKQIEMLNRYEARDVQEKIYGDRVTITVRATMMSPTDSYRKSAVKLQNENLRLKKKIARLEAELEKVKGGTK